MICADASLTLDAANAGSGCMVGWWCQFSVFTLDTALVGLGATTVQVTVTSSGMRSIG
jgi:hypothetical protein